MGINLSFKWKKIETGIEPHIKKPDRKLSPNFILNKI
jgi:hypothetical protein